MSLPRIARALVVLALLTVCAYSQSTTGTLLGVVADPTDAANFRCVGVWYIGPPPVGRRCFTTSGGSPFVLTVFGVIPVAQVLQGGLDNILTAGTDYLQQLRRLQAMPV